MNRSLPGCRLPRDAAGCLPQCEAASACAARSLLLVDGRTLLGVPTGVVGDTLRFQSAYPERGPVLLPFREVEPLSLAEALAACAAPGDAEALLRLARDSASRGLLDLALRQLDRALGAAPAREPEIREVRSRMMEECARRGFEDAREYLAARRPEHALATLDEVLRRFPDTPAAREARALRRTLAG
jgi:tetratricopeptide (TPR) repeat protein